MSDCKDVEGKGGDDLHGVVSNKESHHETGCEQDQNQKDSSLPEFLNFDSDSSSNKSSSYGNDYEGYNDRKNQKGDILEPLFSTVGETHERQPTFPSSSPSSSSSSSSSNSESDCSSNYGDDFHGYNDQENVKGDIL